MPGEELVGIDLGVVDRPSGIGLGMEAAGGLLFVEGGEVELLVSVPSRENEAEDEGEVGDNTRAASSRISNVRGGGVGVRPRWRGILAGKSGGGTG